MSILSVENLSKLSDERRAEILSRSMIDVSDVYSEMRAVVEDIGRRGDMVSVEHYRKYKSDITTADITATEAEVRSAYEQVSEEVIQKEMEIYRAQAEEMGKPEKMIDKIAEGKLNKFYKENCLMNQPYVRDPNVTVTDLLNEMIGKIGENITIRRFSRFQLGES